MRHAPLLTFALLAAALPFVACTDSPDGAETPPAEPDVAGVPHDQNKTAPTSAFERIRDGMAGQGELGAEAAWKAGKPAFLVFAASW